MTRPRVLNTRAREQAAELSELLRAAGFESVEAPSIEIAPAWDTAALEPIRAALRAGEYAWIVLASQNAGRYLLEGLAALGGGRGDVIQAGARIVCGTATAQALDLVPAQSLDHFSAAAALDVLREAVTTGDGVLVPRAAEGRDELVDGLRQLGVRVDAPVCYRTRSVDPSQLAEAARLLREGALHAVTFASPSAVRGLIDGLGSDARPWLTRPAIVCIGETTAEAARLLGLRVDGVAERTSLSSLVEGVARALEVAA